MVGVVWHTVGTKTISERVNVPVVQTDPVTNWSVSVNPTTVTEGGTVTVSVHVSTSRNVPLRANINLFGSSKTVEGNPPLLTAQFTAPHPSKPTTYTGSVTLEWGEVIGPNPIYPNPHPYVPKPPVY